MEKLVKVLHKKLEQIEMEHLQISEKIRQVENDRHSLIAHISGLNNASENGVPILEKFIDELERLEMKLHEKSQDEGRMVKKEENIKQERICKYQNRGYCKFNTNCKNTHFNEICKIRVPNKLFNNNLSVY